MKFVIVGYGIQGKKREKILGKSCVAIVDIKKFGKNTYKKIEQISLNKYDSVILCVPDKLKLNFINFCIKNKKNILVEKPLIFKDPKEIKIIEKNANKNKVLLSTAYNHRFEKSLIFLKTLVQKKKFGKIYNFKLQYLNGTAKNVFETWRDKNGGVVNDLTPHLLDIIFSIFGVAKIQQINFINKKKFENKSFDHALISFNFKKIDFFIEVSYCNWKNTFEIVANGEKGSLKISSLQKWSDSKLSLYKRVLPSGVPIETLKKFRGKDNSFKDEIINFKKLIKEKKKTNLNNDYYINKFLNKLI